ncbi:MAG TPA: LysM domain-containing protein [Gaiellaceae bacterium]|nr:LysM domain-containing protein [Gaiellaceae bacterium]
MNADKIRIWIARFAAPLAFFFAATVLVILVQRALEFDETEAGTNTTSTVEVDTGPTTSEPGETTALPRGCRRPRYTVRRGDTLESIAAKCEVPLSDLLELNPNIDPLTLNPGDRIRIRPPQQQGTTTGAGTETETQG